MTDERFKSFDLKICRENITSDTLKVIEIIEETTDKLYIEYKDSMIRIRQKKPKCSDCKVSRIGVHQIESRKLHFFHIANFNVKVD